jgi:hypothetical protein
LHQDVASRAAYRDPVTADAIYSAGIDFNVAPMVSKAQVIALAWPPGGGKSHLAAALGQ